MKKLFAIIASSLLALNPSVLFAATPQAETLGRGAVVVKPNASRTVISWRSLENDDPAMTFDVFADGVKVNASPINNCTFYSTTNIADGQSIEVRASVAGEVVELFSPVAAASAPYLRLPLDRPEGGTTPDGKSYTYTPNDCSVGDVDGDGEYEIFVKWDPSNQADNSQRWYTGNVYIDCYRLDGTKLWRIDLGRNIRAGAHYTQFMVYDLDGDGRAELACKTAPGTVDGLGNYVLMGNDDPSKDYRNSQGIIISGPEYLTVFSGATGAELATVSYVPLRSVQAHSKSGWGDDYGNRCERYLACVAYLDGIHPSLVMCRGYYTHSYLCAWDFDGKNLTQRWLHASTVKGQGAYGEGCHSLSVGDVDGDGCDEIIYGSAAIDHDGSLLHRTGGGHGDALHLGDLDPDNPGLEVYMVHEEKGSGYKYDASLRDARTGKMLWYAPQSGNDIGRGMAADVSASHPGHELWASNWFNNGEKLQATFDCKGNKLSDKRYATCFRLYWDGDPLDELFDGSFDSGTGKASPSITKVNDACNGVETLLDFTPYNAQSCNTTKATPCLSADILGDWREEVILWDGANSSDLLIFTTTTSTKMRVPCLMQDHTYRMAVAWQNVAYNQPPHLGYALAERYDVTPAILLTEGSQTQTVELGDPMATLVGTWKNMNKVTVSGCKNGIQYSVDPDAKTFTISGTPTAVGTYNIYVMSSGASTSVNFKITVNVVAPVELESVAYLPFDEVGATTPNLCGNDGVAVGAPALVEGKWAGAASLDGVADYFTIEAYDAIQLADSDFTIELNFRSTDDAAYLFHKGSLANNGVDRSGNWIGIELKNGNLTFAVDDDVTKSSVATPATGYFDGEWHHLVCVREHAAGLLKIYLDGVMQAEAADKTGALADFNEPLIIGNVCDLNNFYVGDFDDLTIYRGAMSAAKVAKRYESGAVESIIADSDADATPIYYDLHGRRVANPTHGIYILRRGTRTAKIRL